MLSPDSLDWTALGDDLDARGFAVTDPLLDAAECAALADLFDVGRFRSTVDLAPPPRPFRRRPLPLHRRHGPPPLRRRPLPLLRPPAAGADRRAARGLLPTAPARREPLVRAPGRRRRRVPARARAAARALPRRRPGTPDTADPALRCGRL